MSVLSIWRIGSSAISPRSFGGASRLLLLLLLLCFLQILFRIVELELGELGYAVVLVLVKHIL